MGMKRKKRAPRRRGWLLGSSATQVICISFVLRDRAGNAAAVTAHFQPQRSAGRGGCHVHGHQRHLRDRSGRAGHLDPVHAFGQAVILLLIQVGGLGLVTLTSFFALAMRRRMGFRDLRLLARKRVGRWLCAGQDVLKIVVGLAALLRASASCCCCLPLCRSLARRASG